MFCCSNAAYHSMLAKSVIQLILGGGMSMVLMWIQLKGLAEEDITCEVFDM